MNSGTAFIIFPHQLFKDITPLKDVGRVYLVEEHLFFNQYKFHQQKLVLHRASMKYYEDLLFSNKIPINYIEATCPENDIRTLIKNLSANGITEIKFYDVCDNWLEKRIKESAAKFNINITEIPTPLFINTKKDLQTYFEGREKYFQTDFYIQQRKKRNVLIDEYGKPLGGKWSFDADNRLKYPKGKTPPPIEFPTKNKYYNEAVEYVEKNYPTNYGKISNDFIYPTTHEQSEKWLEQFFETRFFEFGEYEDAIVYNENILHHSVLTPMLNVGLLLPMQIIEAAIQYASQYNISINSLEGFIRQIMGWREFIRGVYIYRGTMERNTNYWKFERPVPGSFYSANTGIEPLDQTIQKVLDTGYCHHIERLMILGNFMVLTEMNPDEVYQWFMEMFIDSYDWVMVPNVYGMSQFADGGLMATKPYISGSNYIMKMSNYKKGEWQNVWDGLFWHFMNQQRHFFQSNPRLGMLINSYDKMEEEKKQRHQTNALKFTEMLYSD